MKILQVNSSARHAEGNSTRIANAIVARLRRSSRDITLTIRDLAVDPHPLLDAAALGALYTPADQRSSEQAERVALDDALIAQVKAAEVRELATFGETIAAYRKSA